MFPKRDQTACRASPPSPDQVHRRCPSSVRRRLRARLTLPRAMSLEREVAYVRRASRQPASPLLTPLSQIRPVECRPPPLRAPAKPAGAFSVRRATLRRGSMFLQCFPATQILPLNPLFFQAQTRLLFVKRTGAAVGFGVLLGFRQGPRLTAHHRRSTTRAKVKQQREALAAILKSRGRVLRTHFGANRGPVAPRRACAATQQEREPSLRLL
jgi:hypothetical protein